MTDRPRVTYGDEHQLECPVCGVTNRELWDREGFATMEEFECDGCGARLEVNVWVTYEVRAQPSADPAKGPRYDVAALNALTPARWEAYLRRIGWGRYQAAMGKAIRLEGPWYPPGASPDAPGCGFFWGGGACGPAWMCAMITCVAKQSGRTYDEVYADAMRADEDEG